MTPHMMDEGRFGYRAVSLWEEGEALEEILPGSDDDDVAAELEELGDEPLDEDFSDDVEDDDFEEEDFD